MKETIIEGSRESRIVPDPIHAEVRVQVQLPPEAQALLRDLHNDRQSIGVGSLVILACTVIMTAKQIFGHRQ